MSSSSISSSNGETYLRRYSLRTLLIATSLLGVLLAWVANEVRQRRHEQQLEAMCIRLGATMSYTKGDHGRITGVDFSNYNDLNDEHLKRLAGLSRLRVLHLQLTKVSERGLAALEDFPALRELHVNAEQLSPDGVRHLKRMPSLRELRVWGDGPEHEPCIGELLQVLPNLNVNH